MYGGKKRQSAQDHYEILGVDFKSTPAQIKKAFHKAALENHPDKTGGSAFGEAFVKVRESYEVLINATARAKYDLTYKPPPASKTKSKPFEGTSQSKQTERPNSSKAKQQDESPNTGSQSKPPTDEESEPSPKPQTDNTPPMPEGIEALLNDTELSRLFLQVAEDIRLSDDQEAKVLLARVYRRIIAGEKRDNLSRLLRMLSDSRRRYPQQEGGNEKARRARQWLDIMLSLYEAPKFVPRPRAGSAESEEWRSKCLCYQVEEYKPTIKAIVLELEGLCDQNSISELEKKIGEGAEEAFKKLAEIQRMQEGELKSSMLNLWWTILETKQSGVGGVEE
ncbi:uncharacterized protein PAC_15428 [Phialocephala subalpina]|uniref:J domain-containing protein n=1 Tax=Phialocephala subalpina TaxID=576137 RepID=A0A1L7XKI2_9HELO|nr:uncharacterized protein PAC_15428 [Phialocephala subalpina]